MTEKRYTKLNDENYDAWEFEMRAVLKKKGVWSIASGEESRLLGSPNHNAMKGWMKRRDVAAGEIIERLDLGQFAHVRSHEDDPAEMWKHLEKFHMASGLGSLVTIWHKFTWITKADSTPIRAHITEIRTIADRLTRLGDKLSDVLIIATLLGSLPKMYHPLIIALDAHPEAGDLDFMIGQVINEAITLEHFNPDTPSIVSPENELMALQVDVRKITCHNCGIVGHFASNCQKQPNPYAKPTKPWDAANTLADRDHPTATLAITETAYAL